ncbi:MAG: DUF5655 domain-containing protein [Thermoanaerobaculia bacterium]
MSSVDQALATQLANIEKRTGRKLAELAKLLEASGLEKHGEQRDFLKSELGMGHGDANTVVTLHRRGDLASAAKGEGTAPAGAAKGGDTGSALDAIYAGGKEPLRPIHEALMAKVAKFGEFEIAPKKAYVSLRRKKQFAMIGPPAKNRVEVGLNMKGVPATARLLALPPGGMCQYKVNVTELAEVDEELLAWIRTAYDAAG